jgi:hypothetical protein
LSARVVAERVTYHGYAPLSAPGGRTKFLRHLTHFFLVEPLTDILLRAEGFDPGNQIAQSVSVVFLHRPADVFVAGARSTAPRYRIIPSAPEGQYSDVSRKALVKEVTEAVVRAEGGTFEDVAPRVWVFPTEIPDGQWGSRGVIRRLPEIQAFIEGEHGTKGWRRSTCTAASR